MSIFERNLDNDLFIKAYSDRGEYKIWIGNRHCPLFESRVQINRIEKGICNDLHTSGIFLTKSQSICRKLLVDTLNIPLQVVTDIIVAWAVFKHPKDFRDKNFVQLHTGYVPVNEIVESPFSANVFCVVDIDMSDCSLFCVELEKDSLSVVGTALLKNRQVKVVQLYLK